MSRKNEWWKRGQLPVKMSPQEEAVFEAIRRADFINRLLPNDVRPMGYKSCMPEVIRERWEKWEMQRQLDEEIRNSPNPEFTIAQHFRTVPSNDDLDLWWDVMTEWLSIVDTKERFAIKGYVRKVPEKLISIRYARKYGERHPDRKTLRNWRNSGLDKIVKMLISRDMGEVA